MFSWYCPICHLPIPPNSWFILGFKFTKSVYFTIQSQTGPFFALWNPTMWILVSIRKKYLHRRELRKDYESNDEYKKNVNELSRTKLNSPEEGAALYTIMIENDRQSKRYSGLKSVNKELMSNKHSKYVTNLFSIYYSVKSGKRWHDIHPNAVGRGANGKNAKIFHWPFTYRYKEKLSWDENISKFKSRYYLCLAITILSPIYHVVINFAYLLGLSAKAMEYLWQYPYLFSIVFLLDIILTGNMLRQTSGDSILWLLILFSDDRGSHLRVKVASYGWAGNNHGNSTNYPYFV